MPDQQISTKCENPAKVRLVGWFWAPPGTKSGVKCAWCSLSKNADFHNRLIQSSLQNFCRVWRKHQVRKPGKSAPGGYVASNLLWVFPFRGPVRTEGRCELKRKGCCSNNVRGSSLVSFKRALPPKEREAFYVSRGFPYLMVAASYSSSLLKMQQLFSNPLVAASARCIYHLNWERHQVKRKNRGPLCAKTLDHYPPESWPGILWIVTPVPIGTLCPVLFPALFAVPFERYYQLQPVPI